MAGVGQIVEEAIDLMNSGLHGEAMLPTAMSIEATAAKVNDGAPVGELSIERYVRESWPLIAFMGMPRALPLPLNMPFQLKRIVPEFNSLHGAPEMISFVLNKTLLFHHIPAEFGFSEGGEFEIKDGIMLLPAGTVCGLLGSVIFHPCNEGEDIGENYWINISDFKMFVSELFGKKDLAERVMRFYLD